MITLKAAGKGCQRLKTGMLHNLQKRGARAVDMPTRQMQSQCPIDRYREKLEAKAKSEGFQDIEDLRKAHQDKTNTLRRETQQVLQPLTDLSSDKAQSAHIRPVSAEKKTSKTPVKGLAAYIDVDKILQHNSDEIEYIWRARHASSENKLCAVIPQDTFAKVAEKAKKNPMFVLPLPRGPEQVEMHFLQWSFLTPDTVTCMFTNLAEYKLKGEFARPHTTLTHHLDIADQKGVVLMEGDVEENSGMKPDHAKWLVMTLQKFYGASQVLPEGRKRTAMLEQFSHGDGGFDFTELISESKKLE